MLLKKTSTSLIFTKLIVFRALFASEILRVDSPVSNIIYVPQVRPPRLPWCKSPDIFVGQHMTRHNKKEATVRLLPNSSKGRKLGYGRNTQLCLGICFPGPSWYALQTSKPLSSNWTFRIWLMLSSFANGSQDTSTHSQKTKFTAGTPPHERIASLESQYRCLRSDGFSCAT